MDIQKRSFKSVKKMYAQPIMFLEASLFSTLKRFQLFTRVGESSLTLLFTFFFISIGRKESITLDTI